MTVLDLIKGSLRLIGAIASGEAPSAAEVSDAIECANDMLDSWSNEGLMIPQTTIETFTLIANSAITMGPTGDFDTVRPMSIDNVTIKISGLELPVKILTVEEWANVRLKTITSTIPQYLYVEDSYPLKTLHFWPVPAVGNDVGIYSKKPLTAFVASGDDVSVPPGYQRAIKYNLATELAPEYGKEISPKVESVAMQSKALLKRQNSKPRLMRSDIAGMNSNRKSFNLITGE